MRTVRDFKRFVLKESRSYVGASWFSGRSDAHREFWLKLNRLGARNMKEQSPLEVPDIDATVELSDAEWQTLEAEFRQLK